MNARQERVYFMYIIRTPLDDSSSGDYGISSTTFLAHWDPAAVVRHELPATVTLVWSTGRGESDLCFNFNSGQDTLVLKRVMDFGQRGRN